MSKMAGEAEGNLRKAFEEAEKNSPSFSPKFFHRKTKLGCGGGRIFPASGRRRRRRQRHHRRRCRRRRHRRRRRLSSPGPSTRVLHKI